MERLLLLVTVALLPIAYARGLLLEFVNMPKLTMLFVVVCFATSLRVAAAALGTPSTGLRLLLLPASVMSLAFLVSWLASDHRSWSLLGLYGRYAGLLPYLAVILFAVLLADAFAGRPEPVLYSLVAGGAGVGLYALVQMLFLGALIATNSPTAYVTSTLGHSNFAGGYLATILPLSLGMWIQGGRVSRWGVASTVLITSGLLFTVSQGGWIAGIGGSALLAGLAAGDRHRWAPRLGALMGAGAAGVAVAAIAVPMAIPHAYAKLPAYLSTAVSRGFLWESAFAAAAAKPLLGHGPNAYAIEGPLHRSVESALFTNFVKGDEPHSIPLAMLANLGLVGLTSFAFLFVWALMKWRSDRPSSVLRTATLAAIGAYGIQALVSIDEPALRFAFWVLLASTACFAVKAPSQSTRRSSLRFAAPLAWIAIGIGVFGAGLATVGLPLADYKANRGTQLFTTGAVVQGRTQFLQALALRDDNEYRRRYGGALGIAALEGHGGQALVDEMKEQFSYLDSFPDAQALAFYGELLNLWSSERAEANEEALQVYERATELDPYNPLLAVDVSDALLQEGRPAEAEEHLERFERLLTEQYPEYAPLYSDVWSSLAMARATLGRDDEARAALARVSETGSCRYLIATELLKPRDEQERSPALAFQCTETLLQLLPQEPTSST